MEVGKASLGDRLGKHGLVRALENKVGVKGRVIMQTTYG